MAVSSVAAAMRAGDVVLGFMRPSWQEGRACARLVRGRGKAYTRGMTSPEHTPDPLVEPETPPLQEPPEPEQTPVEEPETPRKERLEPTRYGDWELNGKCVDF